VPQGRDSQGRAGYRRIWIVRCSWPGRQPKSKLQFSEDLRIFCSQLLMPVFITKRLFWQNQDFDYCFPQKFGEMKVLTSFRLHNREYCYFRNLSTVNCPTRVISEAVIVVWREMHVICYSWCCALLGDRLQGSRAIQQRRCVERKICVHHRGVWHVWNLLWKSYSPRLACTRTFCSICGALLLRSIYVDIWGNLRNILMCIYEIFFHCANVSGWQWCLCSCLSVTLLAF